LEHQPQVFCALIAHARQHRGTELVRWWPQRRATWFVRTVTVYGWPAVWRRLRISADQGGQPRHRAQVVAMLAGVYGCRLDEAVGGPVNSSAAGPNNRRRHAAHRPGATMWSVRDDTPASPDPCPDASGDSRVSRCERV
jgi:hypothetical protein